MQPATAEKFKTYWKPIGEPISVLWTSFGTLNCIFCVDPVAPLLTGGDSEHGTNRPQPRENDMPVEIFAPPLASSH
jgi:hypothetical protein